MPPPPPGAVVLLLKSRRQRTERRARRMRAPIATHEMAEKVASTRVTLARPPCEETVGS